ncbi:unnamed protein product [Mytilus coruscus]|uniref:MAM domain-containing protein n=1 Tax=Mytilus coruscus TaxID=42192 RepID=A0A6J8DT77_MYTCO|nr:unnamed protein product [Mytilus coruscus]
MLISDTTYSGDDVCFTFWYHMYGDNMGTLNVYTKSRNITRKHWSQSGNQGNSWNFANFDIASSEPYTIIFEGISGEHFESDIALDDIIVLQRSCSGLINYSQSCHKTDESISITGCSKYYLQLNNTSIMFDPKFDDCSGVYQEAQTSTRTLCNDIKNSDTCTFNLSEVIMKEPRCFQPNRLLIRYTCEVGMPMYTIIGVSALVVVFIAALVFTVVTCNRRKKAKHSQPCEIRTNPTATERNNSSDYATVNYNEMTDVSLPEIHQTRNENSTTHRERPAITAAIKQVGINCNKYESLSNNRNLFQHIYESESIPTNQYESLTKERELDKHTYESTEHTLPLDITTSIEQEDNICNKYESLSTNRNSVEHIYKSESIPTNQYELLTNQQESVEHTYESTEHESHASAEPNLSQYQSLTNPSESDTHPSTSS